MALKRLLFIGGAVGGIVALKRRSDGDQIQQVVERVKDAAPEPVKQAVDRITPGGDSDGGGSRHERYQPPAEAGSQPPTTPGGPPSDASPVREASSVASEPGDQLNTPHHDLPEDVVMPDTSADDPLVREQEKAAAADAGNIGGNVDAMAANEPGFPEDPATRPVVEGSGDAEETFEARDEELGGNREK